MNTDTHTTPPPPPHTHTHLSNDGLAARSADALLLGVDPLSVHVALKVTQHGVQVGVLTGRGLQRTCWVGGRWAGGGLAGQGPALDRLGVSRLGLRPQGVRAAVAGLCLLLRKPPIKTAAVS